MKRVVRFLFLTPIMFLLGCNTGQEHSFSPYQLSNSEKEKLREGDIILRYGEGLASDMIVEVLDEEREVSHCGILSRKEDGGFRVIHSVSSSISKSDGMQAQSLDRFIAQSVDSTVMVVRYKGKGAKNVGPKIARKAEHYLDQKIPFDPSFDLSSRSKFYCTELIERSFKESLGRSILKGHLDRPYGHLHFDLFWKSDRFRTIIDHHR